MWLRCVSIAVGASALYYLVSVPKWWETSSDHYWSALPGFMAVGLAVVGASVKSKAATALFSIALMLLIGSLSAAIGLFQPFSGNSGGFDYPEMPFMIGMVGFFLLSAVFVIAGMLALIIARKRAVTG